MIHAHMEKYKFMDPVVLSYLIKLYKESDEPELIKHIWNYILKNKYKPNSITYNLILTTCADWAKKTSGTPDAALELGEEVYKHLRDAQIKYGNIDWWRVRGR